ncbi:MAG: BamA/TamA family outer membrane protein [Siphonobacter sp.]
MKASRTTYQLILVLSLILAGCNLRKYVPAKEKIYAGTEIEMVEYPGVSKNERNVIKTQLETLARPKPNGKFRVWLYYVIGQPKKDSSFRATLRRKLGKEPVYATSRSIIVNTNVWANYLENEGYFHPSIEGHLEEKGYEAKGVYKVLLRPRYMIDSVRFIGGDTALVGKDFKQAEALTLLKPNTPYKLDNVKLELERISQALKRKGYFYFNSNYVAVLADSAKGDHKTRLYMAIKPDMPEAAGRQYYIRNVYVYPNYTLSNAAQDTNRSRAFRTTGGLRVVDSSRSYDERLFHGVIGFKPGRRYNSRVQDVTLSRLINLGTFKFVRNRFAPDIQGDSTVLDVHYYLTPYPKKSLQIEIAGTSKSTSLAGTQLTVSWRDRNVFRRGELLTINASGGIEVQVGANNQGVTNYSYGLDATITYPRLVSPFKIDYDRRQVLPKTNVSIGYKTILRSQLYRINSFSTSFGYSFRGNTRVEHTVVPLSLSYVFVPESSLGDKFYELLTDPNVSPQYFALIQGNRLIPSSLYTLHFNSAPQVATQYSQQLIFNFEPAGNVFSLLFKKDSDGDGFKDLFGVTYSQYVKADVDTRHYLKINPDVTWASRAFVGTGIPYGNSTSLPFVKQYFVGGSNSIRAFRPRAVGPGRYVRDTDDSTPLLQDGGGDMKLEVNTELRMKFNKYLNGALFVDAGNVWVYKDETLYGAEAVFSKDFLKELAVGTGIGLRIDITYFVLRFDLAMPLRKPWLEEKNRWVFNQINFGDSSWRKDNLLLNIAVGYPF